MTRSLIGAALALLSACGSGSPATGGATPGGSASSRQATSFTHDEVMACLRDAGLRVAEGGRLHGEPGISIEGGSALVVVFDSNDSAESTAREPFFSRGETDARANAFVYFAPSAFGQVREKINSCVPPDEGS